MKEEKRNEKKKKITGTSMSRHLRTSIQAYIYIHAHIYSYSHLEEYNSRGKMVEWRNY